MTAASTLRSARKLIEYGWIEPMSQTEEGLWCFGGDMRARKFCVHDALVRGSLVAADCRDAMEYLERICAPSWHLLEQFVRSTPAESATAADILAAHVMAKQAVSTHRMQAWLEQPERTQAHVLRAFDLAILAAERLTW